MARFNHVCFTAMGNIKTDKVSDIYSSEEAEKMRAKIKKGNCPHCWMNCYSPHSIMQHPFKSIYYLIKKLPIMK